MQKSINKLILFTTFESAKALKAEINAEDFAIENIELIKIQSLKILPLNTNFEILIFNSINAIKHGWQYFADINTNEPLVFSLGEKSAQELQKHFTHVFFPQNSNDSEGLIVEIKRQHINLLGKKIAIIKGEGGREFLAQELTRMGALVHEFSVYRRVADIALCQKLNAIDFTKIFALILISVEVLEILIECFGRGVVNKEKQLEIIKLPLVVNHWKICNKAIKYGFTNIILAENFQAIPKVLTSINN